MATTDDHHQRYLRCFQVYLDRVTSDDRAFIAAMEEKLKAYGIVTVLKWPTIWPEVELLFHTTAEQEKQRLGLLTLHDTRAINRRFIEAVESIVSQNVSASSRTPLETLLQKAKDLYGLLYAHNCGRGLADAVAAVEREQQLLMQMKSDNDASTLSLISAGIQLADKFDRLYHMPIRFAELHVLMDQMDTLASAIRAKSDSIAPYVSEEAVKLADMVSVMFQDETVKGATESHDALRNEMRRLARDVLLQAKPKA